METAIQIYLKEQGLEILPDTAQYRNRFNIKSESSNRLYVVSQRVSDNAFCCSCPSWITRRYCKHLTTLKPLLEGITKIENKRLE